MPNQSARAFLYSLQEGDDRARESVRIFCVASCEATLNATHKSVGLLGLIYIIYIMFTLDNS